MQMLRIKAREILAMAHDDVMKLPDWIVVEFDDGALLETTNVETFYSRCFWEFHKEFPKIPILESHHLSNVTKDDPYGDNSHLRVCEAIQETILNYYDWQQEKVNFKVARLTKYLTNDMTNYMSKYASSHSGTITLEELIYVHRHPEMMVALEGLKNGTVKPEEAYAVGHKLLMKDPQIAMTGLGVAYRGASIKRNQCLQALVSVGVRTEADGTIFDWSVPNGYLEGITEIADFAADACAAPKALKSAEGPIQESDTMSRRLKLVANVIKSVVPGDCGTERTWHWFVLPEIKENGEVIQKSGLKGLVGRYHYDQEGELKRINGDEKELEGTYIHLRDINRCAHDDPHSCCSVCFGDLCYNLVEVTNVGYSCVAAFMSLIIQLTLSVKHVVGSAVGEGIRISPDAGQFFKTGKKKNQYYFNAIMKKLKPKIIITRTNISGLDKLKMVDMEDVSANQISRVSRILIKFTENNSEVSEIVDISQGSRAVFMTREFLEFALEKKWAINDEVNYEFDMDGWDFANGLFALPEMEMSFAERGAEIGRMIESNMEEIADRYKPDSPLKTAAELYELVSRSLEIPHICLSVLIYANTIWGPNDYRLGRHSKNPVLGVSRLIIRNRSLANALSFQVLTDIILNPRSFFPNGRPDSPMDVFFDPQTVVSLHERGLLK